MSQPSNRGHFLLCLFFVLVSLTSAGACQAAGPSPADRERIEGKMEEFQVQGPQWIAAGGDRKKIMPLQQDLERAMKRGDFRGVEAALDKLLALVGGDGKQSESTAGPSPAERERIEGKMEEFQAQGPRWIAAGGDPGRIKPLQQDLERASKRGDFRGVEAALDKLLALVGGSGEKHASEAGGVQLRVYDATGAPVPRANLEVRFHDFAVTTGVFPLDVEYEPVLFGVASVNEGMVTLKADLPDRVVFHFFPDVEDFGQVKVYADAGGEGYARDELPEIFDLPLEAARSRIAKTRTLMESYPKAAFREETRERRRAAERHLSRAIEGGGSREQEVYRALSEALWAGEMATVDAARHDIRKRGKRKDFLIGIGLRPANTRGASAKYISENFNFVTVPEFFLAGFEKKRGKTNYAGAERMIDWARNQGLEVKGHPLIYLVEPNIPSWLQGASFEKLKNAMYTRIERDVAYFKGRVRYWDIVNEANNPIPLGITQDQITDLTVEACKLLKKTDPSAVAVINVNMPLGDHLAANKVALMASKGRARTAYRYFRDINKAGADYDVVGLQWYYWGLDIMEAARLIDRFSKLGKPIHLSEVAFSSSKGVDRKSAYFQDQKVVASLGSWHGPWSEESQADYLEQLYTVAYSKPAVEAVTWWDLVDEFWPHGGLIDADGSEKAAYKRLRSVVKSW